MQVSRVQTIRDYHFEALALVEEWFPSLWVRDGDCRTWTPARPSSEPPTITDAVMEGLVDNGLVGVRARTLKGHPEVIHPLAAVTSKGAAMRYSAGRLTTEESRV